MATYFDEEFEELYGDELVDYPFHHYQKAKIVNPKKMTYPYVLFPFPLLEIKKLQPSLPNIPQKPQKPREPYKPSEKYNSDDNLPVGCALFPGLLFLIILLWSGIDYPFILWFIAIGFTGIGIIFLYKNWTRKEKYENEYPSKLAKYNIEMKQYQKEKQEHEKNMQEYKNQCSKYEKDKEEILSARNIGLYHDKIFKDRLKQSIRPTPNVTLAKKGVSENYFYSLLIEHFGDKIQSNLSFSNNGSTYFPDLIYWDKSINLIIDIEIDEPYVGHSGTPIHYTFYRNEPYSERTSTSTIDNDRDNAIRNGGWIVVKFAEQQIFQDSSGCIAFLDLVVENTKKMNFNVSNQNFLIPVDRWTKDEAFGMGYKRFRFSYVPKKYHELLKVDDFE